MWGFLEFFLKPNLDIIVYWPVELWKLSRLKLNAFYLNSLPAYADRAFGSPENAALCLQAQKKTYPAPTHYTLI